MLYNLYNAKEADLSPVRVCGPPLVYFKILNLTCNYNELYLLVFILRLRKAAFANTAAMMATVNTKYIIILILSFFVIL